MEVSPMKRSCPSDISVRRRNVSRQMAGSRNGSTPSIISISAKAVSRIFPIAVAAFLSLVRMPTAHLQLESSPRSAGQGRELRDERRHVPPTLAVRGLAPTGRSSVRRPPARYLPALPPDLKYLKNSE